MDNRETTQIGVISDSNICEQRIQSIKSKFISIISKDVEIIDIIKTGDTSISIKVAISDDVLFKEHVRDILDSKKILESMSDEFKCGLIYEPAIKKRYSAFK